MLSTGDNKQFRGDFLKRNIVIVMGDLDTKVSFGNTLLGHVGMRSPDDRNDNGGRFVDFRSFHSLVIGGTFFRALSES